MLNRRRCSRRREEKDHAKKKGKKVKSRKTTEESIKAVEPPAAGVQEKIVQELGSVQEAGDDKVAILREKVADDGFKANAVDAGQKSDEKKQKLEQPEQQSAEEKQGADPKKMSLPKALKKTKKPPVSRTLIRSLSWRKKKKSKLAEEQKQKAEADKKTKEDAAAKIKEEG